MGAGASRRFSAVRWGVAGNIVGRVDVHAPRRRARRRAHGARDAAPGREPDRVPARRRDRRRRVHRAAATRRAASCQRPRSGARTAVHRILTHGGAVPIHNAAMATRVRTESAETPAQPRALAPRVPRPRARARDGRVAPAARAREVLLDLLLQPRRVLPGARRGPARPGRGGHRRALGRRAHAAAGARADPRARPRADHPPVAALEDASCARRSLPRASSSAGSRTSARRSSRSSSGASSARSTRC